VGGRAKIGFFPGSTIGNFHPEEATVFLAQTRAALGEGPLFLVGVDLVKDPAVLEAAYDDARGVTAAFNRNLLARANRELGADFDVSSFDHRAAWNAVESRMEMHLVSRRDQSVDFAGRRFAFTAGETLHTENSYKFSEAGFRALAEAAGWRVRRNWVSATPEFALFLLG